MSEQEILALLNEHRPLSWQKGFELVRGRFKRDEFRKLFSQWKKGIFKDTDSIEDRLIGIIKKTPHSVEALADKLNTTPKTVRIALDALKERGHNLANIEDTFELSKEIPRSEPTHIPLDSTKGRTIRFGLTADNHLCSTYAREDVLNSLFDRWEAQGIDTVYQLGNMIEGERHSKFELKARGMQGQVDYFVKHWPKRKGITTYFVTGDDHEGWYFQDTGINIGNFIQSMAEKEGRKDLIHLGYMEHDIYFKGTENTAVMRLIHAGGGSSYATSYAVQKIVESYQGGEKPTILLVGHYHKAEYGYPREVHVVQAGTTKDQDSFLRKNKIAAHVGGWTIEFTLTPEGYVTSFKPEWMPYYDRGFYEKRWQHKP